MSTLGAAGIAWLLVPLCLLIFVSTAHGHEDVLGDVAWAYGTVVDSITVTGNKNTRRHVLVREMETRVGHVLTEKNLQRDIHFLNDLSPFARVAVRADSLAPGHCALRILVTPRSGLFLKSILPFLNFDFERGLEYGVKWRDKNFRGRLEDLSLTYTRNERLDNKVSFGWSAPWIGWRHIAIGGNVSYFNRGDTPLEVGTLERLGVGAGLSLPLTDSRINFSQLQAGLTVNNTRQGSKVDTVTIKEVTLSPSLGFRFDNRDSRLRPDRGALLAVSVGASYSIKGERGVFYRLRNELRAFRRVSGRSVLAYLSNVSYQFGDFPDFSTVKLGGSGTLRGRESSRFSGAHRWFETIEWRYLYLPRKVFRAPFVKEVDITLAFVTFVDWGIVWDNASNFDLDRFHGTAGIGIRFYSPVQDVLRLDFGTTADGDARFHFGSGVRF